jgi:hypothetical protein
MSDKTNEPPIGLLMSMAIRYDHALGQPGYYDQPLFKSIMEGTTHADRVEATIRTMRQLWAEVTGNGFYSPDKEQGYADMYAASTKKP